MAMAASDAATGAIVGATILTLDRDRPAATAVAWRGGMLIAVGDDGGLRAALDRQHRVVDGTGSTVMPGSSTATSIRSGAPCCTRGVDLRSARTLDEVRAGSRPSATRCAPESGCSGTARATSRSTTPACAPTRSPRPSATRPALVNFFDGHTALASSAGAAARRRRRRARVRGGRRGRRRRRTAAPTGALLEHGAMTSSATSCPSGREAERLDAYAATLRALNARRAHRRARDDRRPGAARRRAARSRRAAS